MNLVSHTVTRFYRTLSTSSTSSLALASLMAVIILAFIFIQALPTQAQEHPAHRPPSSLAQHVPLQADTLPLAAGSPTLLGNHTPFTLTIPAATPYQHIVWDFGDGKQQTTVTTTTTHIYQQAGTYTVRATLVTSDTQARNPASGTTQVTISAPTLTMQISSPLPLGAPAQMHIDIEDLAINRFATLLIYPGDSSSPIERTNLAAGSSTIEAAHYYMRPGSYTARVQLESGIYGGIVATDTVAIEVITPTITLQPVQQVQPGITTTLVMTTSSLAMYGDTRLEVAFGDGKSHEQAIGPTQVGQIVPAQVISVPHAYNAIGIYTPTARIVTSLYGGIVAEDSTTIEVQPYRIYIPVVRNSDSPCSPAFFDDFDTFDDQRWIKGGDWCSVGTVFWNMWCQDHVDIISNTLRMRLDDRICLAQTACKLDHPYASGDIRSRGFYCYGKFESRIKTTNVNGAVTGFFVFSDNDPDPDVVDADEVDIEILGRDSTKMQTNYFTVGINTTANETMLDLGFDSSQDFHTYGFDWKPDSITWYVDGQAVHTEDGSKNPLPTRPSQIILRLSSARGIGGWGGTFTYPGTPVYAEYDWIRYTPFTEGAE